MISGSPHRYLQQGRQLGRTEEALRAAVTHAKAVETQGLTSVLSLGHLAHQTGANYGYLRRVVSRGLDPYKGFEVRRRRGSRPRYISSPEPILKSVQRWILDHIVGRVETHNISFAYEIGSSIRGCAEQHIGAEWLIKLDVHNFFHSISERQVFGVFNSLGYAALPAFEMTRIVTRLYLPLVEAPPFNLDDLDSMIELEEAPSNYAITDYPPTGVGWLPQGAPTSGALANLVSRPLDVQLARLAAATDTVVTRYADDITFSGTGKFSRSAALSIANRASSLIARAGFEVHHAKTHIVPPGARKIVLGLLVDGTKPRLPKDFRNRLLHHVRGVEKFGIAAHQETARFASAIGLVRHVRGLIDFAYDIDSDWTSPIRQRWDDALELHGWRISEFAD